MLYDFHKWQNDKRPGTMHATYIVYGTKSVPHQEDEDVEMTDSQMSDDVHSAYSDHVPTLTMSLVTEEKLQGEFDKLGISRDARLLSHLYRDFSIIQRSQLHSRLQFSTSSAQRPPAPSRCRKTGS